jgi:E3 ubiquitin-protein ligase MARCH6
MSLKVLIQLDPRRFLQVLHLPIRGMRVITDPIVDSVVYVIVRLLFPRLANMVKAVLRIFMVFVAKYARGLLGSNTTSGISDFSARIVCEISLYSQS